MKERTAFLSVRNMAYVALFTAVLCAAAPFSITIGPIPLSFATLVIYIAAASLGWKRGVLSVALYIALGAVGLPVFSNFEGGFHKIAGYSGGFIIGYIPCALVVGAIIDASGSLPLFPQAPERRVFIYAFGMVCGTVLLYLCGTVWFMIVTGSSLPASLLMTAVPFLPGDAAKIVFACIISPRLRSLLKRDSR